MSTVTAEEVAQLLKITKDAFLRVRLKMEAAGFPKPLNLPSREFAGKRARHRPLLRWSEQRVMDWINAEPEGAPLSEARSRARDKRIMEERFGR